MASHARARRYPPRATVEQPALQQPRLRVRRRLPLQHGPLVARDGRPDGKRCPPWWPAGTPAPEGCRRRRRGNRRGHRCSDHRHRRPRRGRIRRGLHPHRRLGLDGRGQRRVGRPGTTPHPVPGQRRPPRRHRKQQGQIHALPSGIPRPKHHRRPRNHGTHRDDQRSRGHRRCFRIRSQHRLRPSRKPPPHHQSHPRGHARLGGRHIANAGGHMTGVKSSDAQASWYSLSAAEAAARLDVVPEEGLSHEDVEQRLAQYGPNALPTEPPPSVWAVARGQLSNPMNIMLLIVAVASFAIGQIATALFVLGLVTFNVVMGSNQELKARASVEALAQLQVPHARVRRNGRVEEVEATGLVPGDVVLLEAGDLVPADGRIVESATLEVQEAALTGESAPIAKDRGTVAGEDTALGDRTDMVFQNTQVTRGTASFVVTDTGQATQMGRIANMVNATQRSRSPLQQELDGLTKAFGLIAWSAVTVIAIVGIARGQELDTLLLLCISTAIASIPVGLPTFVQTMLSSGARRLAESKAVVKTLTDVETLGGTTVINSDKTGTLTMNAMTATTMLTGGEWFKIEGGGYAKSGAILGSGGGPLPDFRRLALGLVLCTDATVDDDESIIGDPTEAALVVLAAKVGVDAEETRASFARRAEVPFDSEYKFMATFHDRPEWLSGPILQQAHLVCVKGAPDVVVDRCNRAWWHGQLVPMEGVRADILAANQQLSEKGLRVLAFAAKDLDDAAMTAADADPM